jgi:hypothetical protein
MIFEETKKNILKLKLISSIILSFLKLKDLHYSKDSTDIIEQIGSIKNMSNLFYDILSFNVFSILINFVQYYRKIKNGCSFIINKIKNIKNN